MAFKIKVNECGNVEVADNDRGDWKRLHHSAPDIAIIEGFGGENIVVVQYITMQDGGTSILITSTCVDNPIDFRKIEMPADPKDKWGTSHVSAKMNELLAELLTYPATEEEMDAEMSRRAAL